MRRPAPHCLYGGLAKWRVCLLTRSRPSTSSFGNREATASCAGPIRCEAAGKDRKTNLQCPAPAVVRSWLCRAQPKEGAPSQRLVLAGCRGRQHPVPRTCPLREHLHRPRPTLLRRLQDGSPGAADRAPPPQHRGHRDLCLAGGSTETKTASGIEQPALPAFQVVLQQRMHSGATEPSPACHRQVARPACDVSIRPTPEEHTRECRRLRSCSKDAAMEPCSALCWCWDSLSESCQAVTLLAFISNST